MNVCISKKSSYPLLFLWNWYIPLMFYVFHPVVVKYYIFRYRTRITANSESKKR